MLKFVHMFRGLCRCKLGATLTGESANIINSNVFKTKQIKYWFLVKQINCLFLVKKENQNMQKEKPVREERRRNFQILGIELQVVSDFYQTKEGKNIRASGDFWTDVFNTHLEHALSFVEIRDFSEICLEIIKPRPKWSQLSACLKTGPIQLIPQLFSLFCVLHVSFLFSFSLSQIEILF